MDNKIFASFIESSLGRRYFKDSRLNPVVKTNEMTQDVGLGNDGKLYTIPGSGSTSGSCFEVELTYANGAWTSNKTYTQIAEAVAQNKFVYAVSDTMYYYLDHVTPPFAVFHRTFISDDEVEIVSFDIYDDHVSAETITYDNVMYVDIESDGENYTAYDGLRVVTYSDIETAVSNRHRTVIVRYNNGYYPLFSLDNEAAVFELVEIIPDLSLIVQGTFIITESIEYVQGMIDCSSGGSGFNIHTLTSESNLQNLDEFVFYDVSDNSHKKIPYEYIQAKIKTLTDNYYIQRVNGKKGTNGSVIISPDDIQTYSGRPVKYRFKIDGEFDTGLVGVVNENNESVSPNEVISALQSGYGVQFTIHDQTNEVSNPSEFKYLIDGNLVSIAFNVPHGHYYTPAHFILSTNRVGAHLYWGNLVEYEGYHDLPLYKEVLDETHIWTLQELCKEFDARLTALENA